MLRRLVEIIAGLAGVAAIVAWLSGGFAERLAPADMEPGMDSRPPNTLEAVVQRKVGPVFEWASGAIASVAHTVVASRILARIVEVRVRAGDEVDNGDMVIVLESADLRARVAQARDAIKGARARLDFALSEKKRVEKLLKKGVTTRQRYDQVMSDLQVAQSEVNRLKENLREAETQLSYTKIRSPVSGRVIDRLAEPGDTATPGRPLIRIYDPTAPRAEVPVRETLAIQLDIGEPLQVDVPALSEAPGGKLDGKIEEIVPFAEPGARTLLVKIGLPPDSRLNAGMFARAAIPAGQRMRLLIPAAAVERIGQLEFVTVVDNKERLERRLVTTGDYRENGQVEALSGLAAGERVVYAPADPPKLLK